jgi:AraC-like DNA-binding protein
LLHLFVFVRANFRLTRLFVLVPKPHYPVKKYQIMSAPFTIRSAMGGEFDWQDQVPANVAYHRLPGAVLYFVTGPWGHIIFQQVVLEHADIWDSQYTLLCPVKLAGGHNAPFIEFHNSVHNHFSNQWEHIALLNDQPHQGGFSVGPYLSNVVRFPRKAFYRTTDLHFKTMFLADYARAYPKLDAVLNQFERSRFAQIDRVFTHGPYGRTVLQQLVAPPVRASLLSHHYTHKIHEFLCTALEAIDPALRPFTFVQRPASRQLAEDAALLIHQQFAQPLRLATVAQQLYTTISTLQRAFKQRFGQTFHQYLIKTRVARVKQLLLDTSDDLETIAVQTQFHDAAHLSHVFKQLEGDTPIRWRLQRGGKAG